MSNCDGKCLHADLRRLKQQEASTRRYRARRDQCLEDRAFSLFCRHDWDDPCLRLCIQRIVRSAWNLDEETLRTKLEDRYLRTPAEDIADISEGRGGGIPDEEHSRASKCWREMAAVSWIQRKGVITDFLLAHGCAQGAEQPV